MATEVTNAQDLRGRNAEELGQFVREKRDELLKLRFQKSIGQLENVRKVEAVRREIARALTISSQKSAAGKKK